MNGRIFGALILTLLATGFAWLNGGERVELHLGLFRVHSVSLPAVVFAAFLAGMLTLTLASLKADLRSRRMLRRYREALGGESPPDSADAADGS
ncbi:MAG: hypothetical protein OEM96_08925 [Gemmatimonadota bacterium]|nr:hypothetical protein [Gemmatimonadota bacterium]